MVDLDLKDNDRSLLDPKLHDQLLIPQGSERSIWMKSRIQEVLRIELWQRSGEEVRRDSITVREQRTKIYFDDYHNTTHLL